MTMNHAKVIKLVVKKAISIVFATSAGFAAAPNLAGTATDLNQIEQAPTSKQSISIDQVKPTAPALTRKEQAVEMTRAFTHPKLQMTVLSGEINLPAKGFWRPVQPISSLPLSDIFISKCELIPSPDCLLYTSRCV